VSQQRPGVPALPAGPHRRHNPLLDQWVLCSPHRLERPWQGQVEPAEEPRLPAHDPGCYLCPGNTRAGGQRNPLYATTFAFDNDFAALRPDAGPPGPQDETGATDELFRLQGQRGICRVICFSPRHDLTLARMSTPEIGAVIDTWADEVSALGARDFIGYVQLFENKGAMMGCSNPHPHCQIWASEHLPGDPARRLASQRAYFQRHGRDLLGDYLDRERAQGDRIVCENDSWTALVPFWAVWPFETLILPRRRVAELGELASDERAALADVMKRLNVRYDNLFRCSFPYSMAFFNRPFDGQPHPHWRLHAQYLPPLLRSATIRKFQVGYELTAEPQRDLTPEQAADRLRGMPEIHHSSP
jgi:UDPglucose--hexose-1-phosphate uridylyltransferase